jgi:hypothetical protein
VKIGNNDPTGTAESDAALEGHGRRHRGLHEAEGLLGADHARHLQAPAEAAGGRRIAGRR